jgi:hypothetical protein
MTPLALAVAAPAATGGWFVAVAAIITGVGGLSGLTALLLVASQRRKNDAETRKHSADGATALTNAAVGLIKPLEERLTRAESDNRDLRRKCTAQERRSTEQGAEIRRQRGEIRTLLAILQRIRDAVSAPAATTDPAQTVTVVRSLVAHTPDTSHFTTENGR